MSLLKKMTLGRGGMARKPVSPQPTMPVPRRLALLQRDWGETGGADLVSESQGYGPPVPPLP
jgi:hypothetical protein